MAKSKNTRFSQVIYKHNAKTALEWNEFFTSYYIFRMASMKIDKTAHKANIKHFVEYWSDSSKYDEKQHSQSFWNALLRDVLCVERPEEVISYESRVKLSHTSYIDAYIPSTKILIEQKSAKRDLREKIPQSDGTELTPFQQAKRYATQLPRSLYPRYVVTCNFKSFLVYDMETPDGEPQEILLKDLEKEWSRLQFLVQEESNVLQKELEVSIKAGELVGKIYDAFKAEFAKVRGDGSTPGALTVEDLHSLNVLCVRLVFCLYAEDAGIFNKDQFYHFMKSFRPENMRGGLKDLFKILDTKPADRDPFLEEKFKAFPYVNGNLFAEQPGEVIPTITEATANILLEQASLGFDWSEISPTIFGAVFESTLNPETRRKGGMHYTSIENIHKVIDPLFLDARKAELSEIKKVKNTKERNAKLQEFRKTLGEETFFDPACGSGNFLTETYISLRTLENEALAEQHNGEAVLDVMGDEIFVNIHQFYGIEINDFAATVAKTALWIAECQMMQKTAEILHRNLEFLPLKSYGNITVGNALQIDWGDLDERRETKDERGPAFDYIIGNPPFVGSSYCSVEQKNEIVGLFGKIKLSNSLDYVTGWYYKAAQLISGKRTKCAFVSTNSITQGEQVAPLWNVLFGKFGLQIDFAYRTFRWDSESNEEAHVHCVIIGFSCPSCHSERSEESSTPKTIYNSDGTIEIAKNINAYLMDGPNVFIESRSNPLCDAPVITHGSKPCDGGFFILSENEYKEVLKKEPSLAQYIRVYSGGVDFLRNQKRFCFWLQNVSPKIINESKELKNRVESVRQFRLASSSKSTQQKSNSPSLFFTNLQPTEGMMLVGPQVSSGKRNYIPFGFFKSDIIASDKLLIMPKASLYHFGVMQSNVHNAWVRQFAGRLKSDFTYSVNVVYNNFPWPNLDERSPIGVGDDNAATAEKTIEKTAQAILDARALYPDCSLADLYDETTMPIELRKAHQANDAAVMAAYGFNKNITESEIVAELLKMYQQLVSGNKIS